MRRLKSCKRGMTLIEIMVVLVILGLLAGMAAFHLTHVASDARQRIAYAEMKTIKNAITMFKLKTGSYPASIRELVDGEPPDLEDMPFDPWDNEYEFEMEAGKIVICTFGADGLPGGDDENKDLCSNDTR